MTPASLSRACLLTLLCIATSTAQESSGRPPQQQPAAEAAEQTAAPEDAEQTPAPEAAVRGVISDYMSAFNQYDAAAIAAHWKEAGVLVDESAGEEIAGRAAIERDFQTTFEQRKGLALRGRVDTVRFIRPDVAEVSGQAVVLCDGEEPHSSKFTGILVREGERWLIDSIHETLVPPPAEGHDPLRALDFLVGDWVDDSDTVQVKTRVRWAVGGAFLVRSYTVVHGDEQPQEGTQIIGWDSRQQLIRCWMFGSDGSFGDGTWSPSEDGWVVKISQVLADGRVAGGTQVISRIDDDTLAVQLIGQEIAGEAVPASEPVRVIRSSGPADQ